MSRPSSIDAELARVYFLEQVARDRREGKERSLEDYQARFSGFEDVVAEEYATILVDDDDETLREDAAQPRGFGPYQILRRLGTGGQGTVHLAVDTRLHRRVAIKLLHPGLVSEEDLLRFEREAQAASRLDHPGICAVYDRGTHEGRPFIVMRYVPGRSLREIIAGAADSRKPDEPPSRTDVRRFVSLIAKTARALHAAHEAGIVHRDVKPGNVIVDESGDPVIMDFGLARMEESEGPSLTRTGDLFGTPAYMSPEQLAQKRGVLDRRTDVYSLGVTLFEGLAGHRPFRAPTRHGLYDAILSERAPDVRSSNAAVSRDLAVIVETALAKDRDDRYATAEELADDLEAFLEGRSISARAVGAPTRFVRWTRREPAKAALLLLLAVGGPALAAYAAYSIPRVRAQVARERAEAVDKLVAEGFRLYGDHAYSEAGRVFRAALAEDPEGVEALAGLLVTTKPQDRLEVFNEHADLVARYPAFGYLRAWTLHELGSPDEGHALEQTLPAPRTAVDWFLVGTARLRAAQSASPPSRALFEEAAEALHEAVIRSPVRRLIYLRQWGSAAEDADRLDQALTAARAALHADPDDFGTLLMLPGILRKLKRHDEAVDYAERAVALRPGNAKAHHNLGAAYRHLKEPRIEDARRHIERALEIDPRLPEALVGLGSLERDAGRYDEAMKKYREALVHRPAYASAHFRIGWLHKRLGDYDAAIERLAEACRLAPDTAEFEYHLGRAYELAGRMPDAIEAYRGAVGKDPKHDLARRQLGTVLIRQGHVDEGIREFETAIGLNPSRGSSYRIFTTLLLKAGRLEKAEAWLKKTREACPPGQNPPWLVANEKKLAELREAASANP